MAAKILNLDALVEETRTITLNGVSHAVVGMSVEGFVKLQKAAAELVNADGKAETTEDKLKATVEMIAVAVPTLEKDVLMKMSIDRLGMIAQFVNGEDPTEAAGEPAASEEGAEKK